MVTQRSEVLPSLLLVGSHLVHKSRKVGGGRDDAHLHQTATTPVGTNDPRRSGSGAKSDGGDGGGVAQHHLQEILIGQPGGQEERGDDLRPLFHPAGSPS